MTWQDEDAYRCHLYLTPIARERVYGSRPSFLDGKDDRGYDNAIARRCRQKRCVNAWFEINIEAARQRIYR